MSISVEIVVYHRLYLTLVYLDPLHNRVHDSDHVDMLVLKERRSRARNRVYRDTEFPVTRTRNLPRQNISWDECLDNVLARNSPMHELIGDKVYLEDTN